MEEIKMFFDIEKEVDVFVWQVRQNTVPFTSKTYRGEQTAKEKEGVRCAYVTSR